MTLTVSPGAPVSGVFILEDDPVLRDRLTRLLAASPQFDVLAAAGSLSEGQALLADLPTPPDICLVDLGMPDGSGLELIRAAKRLPATKVLVFTMFGDQSSVLNSLEAGADGFVLKDSKPDDLIEALQSTLNGGAPISAAAASHLLRHLRASPGPASQPPAAQTVAPKVVDDFGLTPREKELLELLARGFSQKDVARISNISPHTVSAHIKSIYAKMAVNSRSEAVFEAVQSGLLDLGVTRA
ncbi:MAG: response regulator transcription factor [Hyphomonadaceae bacterium]|jgi:DNA-binding NarL/FixJ family response regulator|nr:response regulator transcription factor [Hyphomonadaceae bacterium]